MSVDPAYLAAYEQDWTRSRASRDRAPLFREWAVAGAVAQSGPRTALDVGCGVGVLSRLLKRTGVATVDVCDVVREAAEEAALSVAGRGFACCPTTISPERWRWDAVTCCETVEHVPDPRGFVAHLAALSRISVVLTTPVGWSYDDPLHLHHWADEGELRAGLGLDVFKAHDVFRIPSRVGDGGRVFLVVGVV